MGPFTLALALAAELARMGPAACPQPPADLVLAAPDTSTVALGIDVDGFAQTPTGAALLPALAGDLALAEALEVADDCGLSVERTYALVLARDGDDGRMLAVQARGLGEPATIACLAERLRARNDGAPPWVDEGLVAGACFPSLALASTLGGGRVWVVNEFTLIWARGRAGGYEDAVAAKLADAAALTAPASLAAELGRLDRGAHLWLAARLDDAARAALPGTWAKDATSLTVAAWLDSGLRARVGLAAAGPTALASTRDRLIASITSLAARLDEYGVEHQVRERARLGIVDGVVVAELELDAGELRQIRAKIAERIRGRGLL